MIRLAQKRLLKTVPIKNSHSIGGDLLHRTDTLSTKLQSSRLKVSQLSNGIRVATEDSPGHFAAVGVFVDAGCRNEYGSYLGMSHFNDRLAFKSTRNMRREDMMDVLERIGGNCLSSNTRENIIYQASVFKHDVPDTLSLFAETVCRPLISNDEIEETRATIEYELNETYHKPEHRIPELAHQLAYLGNTYGNSQICTHDQLLDSHNVFSRDKIISFRKQFYRPSGLVVAGVGVSHDMFCEWTERYFGSMRDESADERPRPKLSVQYTGGERVILEENEEEFTRLFIGFESVPFSSNDVYATSVLQVMLGGGDSFSAGGPGKGMYSRLYTDVLNRYHWAESITAVNFSYKDTGLFGLQATVPHRHTNNMITVIGNELRKVLDSPIGKEELQRAKNQLQTSLFMNLESKLLHLEDLGRQVQMLSRRVSPSEMSEMIEKVESDDIQRVLQKMVSNPATMLIVGSPKPHASQYLTRFERTFGFGCAISK